MVDLVIKFMAKLFGDDNDNEDINNNHDDY